MARHFMIKFLIALFLLDVVFMGMCVAPYFATSGDCDDYALASYNYLKTMRLNPEIMWANGEPQSHVWVQFKLFGKPVIFNDGILEMRPMPGMEITLESLKKSVANDK